MEKNEESQKTWSEIAAEQIISQINYLAKRKYALNVSEDIFIIECQRLFKDKAELYLACEDREPFWDVQRTRKYELYLSKPKLSKNNATPAIESLDAVLGMTLKPDWSRIRPSVDDDKFIYSWINGNLPILSEEKIGMTTIYKLK